MTQQTETPSQNAETLQVKDLDTFVRLLGGWHKRQVQLLEHCLTVPEGQVAQVGDEPELVLQGDVRRGFIMGINMGLMQLGTLPFGIETEDAPTPAE
jgi:hypothetical protein